MEKQQLVKTKYTKLDKSIIDIINIALLKNYQVEYLYQSGYGNEWSWGSSTLDNNTKGRMNHWNFSGDNPWYEYEGSLKVIIHSVTITQVISSTTKTHEL